MMALRAIEIETHSITMKNLALFRPKLRNSSSTNQIARFVNYELPLSRCKCDSIFDSIEELKTLPWDGDLKPCFFRNSIDD